MTAAGGRPMEQMTPAEIRADRAARFDAFADLAGPKQEVARVEDRAVPGPADPVPVRVYWPLDGVGLPGLVYFHGGGFALGNLDGVDRILRALCNASGCVIVSVDYRLAPEHKFPAAVNDAYAAVKYVVEHAAEFGMDPARIAVGGDSAGANLATVACLVARERGGPALAFQLLVYPMVDYLDDRPSLHEFAEGHFLTQPMIRCFWNHYLSRLDDGLHPHASPMQATSLEGMPPALVITAECDPLRDQGEAYAERLSDGGASVALMRYEGAIHGFFNLAGVVDAGRDAIADAGAALRAALLSDAEAAAALG